MCQFLSGFIIKQMDGNIDVLTFAEHSDSHADGMLIFGLTDNDGYINRFAKFEYLPVKEGNGWIWKFKLDEDVRPVWFDEDAEMTATDKIQALVETHKINKDMDFLPVGWFVIANGVTVKRVFRGTTVVNFGTVTLNDGTVTLNDGTVMRNDGTVMRNDGTVTGNYGTVTLNDGTVNRNYGTVTWNDGTVTGNYGTILSGKGANVKNTEERINK